MTSSFRIGRAPLVVILVVGLVGAWAALRDVAGRLAPRDTETAAEDVPLGIAFAPALSSGPHPGDLRDLIVYTEAGVIEAPYKEPAKPRRQTAVAPSPRPMPNMTIIVRTPPPFPQLSRPFRHDDDSFREPRRPRRSSGGGRTCDLPGCP